MNSFLGEYEVAIDPKGRFSLPVGFRKQLPEEAAGKFVVNRGIEKCLSLYTVDEWNVISAKIKKYNDFNPKVRDFKRGFFNGATMVEVDSAGRLLIPKQLLEYAGIKKDMVMAPCDNKMELWDNDNYSEYMNKVNMNFSDLAEQVMGGDLMDPTEI